MGRHVIIGRGNLGLDLQAALQKEGHEVTLLTASGGFRCPESIPDVVALQPNYVWVTAGHGSVEQVKRDFPGAMNTHVALPVALMNALPASCKLGLFSTDYVADEKNPSNPFYINPAPRSLYAYTKAWMEQVVRGSRRGNTTIFRVGSLYGNHIPEKTFPGKLKVNFPTPCLVELPINMVCPTPTHWIAEVIAERMIWAFDDSKVITHHVAPIDGVTLTQFGSLILGPDYEVRSKGIDQSRPPVSGLSCTFQKHRVTWRHLWDQHLAR